MAGTNEPRRMRFKVDQARLDWIARFLLNERSEPSLNDVDGMFYWECCRQDFVASLSRLIEGLPEDPDHRRHEILRGFMPEALHDVFGIPLEWSYARLMSGVSVPIRPLLIRASAGTSSPFLLESIVATVTTATIDGIQFANSLFHWFENRRNKMAEGHIFYFHAQGDLDIKETRLRFHQESWGDIVVRVWLPLPNKTVLAATFDAYVSDNIEWQRLMPGYEAKSLRPSLKVTIRTWVVGLLVGSGWTWNDAMTHAEHNLGLPETAQPGFNNDRDRLLLRVPEARSFLYQRPRRKGEK